jgi:molybdopterin molybdotransferase/putative molybdopterin biosynthesis protein
MELTTYSRKEALERLFAVWKPESEAETVALEEAYGRITAEPVLARLTIPVVRASAMDGIAVRSSDFVADDFVADDFVADDFVANDFAPGPPPTGAWLPGRDYVRADTGDDFDDRFDAVIKVEDLEFLPPDGQGLRIKPGLEVRKGLNVMPAGSVIREGETILGKGLPVRSCDLGALAEGGVDAVSVVKKPRVAFIPTGNELVEAGKKPGRGQRVDSNSVMARRMLLEMGAEPILYPLVKDDYQALKAVFFDALERSDIVIINGGSSKGSEDYAWRIIAEAGEAVCHGVAAAPGRPLMLALCRGRAVVNAPGPLAACWFCMDWCVRALVSRALGIPTPRRPRVEAVLSEGAGSLKNPGMELLSRIELYRKKNGGFEARPVKRGFANAQAALNASTTAQGSEIQAELLMNEAFIPEEAP